MQCNFDTHLVHVCAYVYANVKQRIHNFQQCFRMIIWYIYIKSPRINVRVWKSLFKFSFRCFSFFCIFVNKCKEKCALCPYVCAKIRLPAATFNEMYNFMPLKRNSYSIFRDTQNRHTQNYVNVSELISLSVIIMILTLMQTVHFTRNFMTMHAE